MRRWLFWGTSTSFDGTAGPSCFFSRDVPFVWAGLRAGARGGGLGNLRGRGLRRSFSSPSASPRGSRWTGKFPRDVPPKLSCLEALGRVMIMGWPSPGRCSSGNDRGATTALRFYHLQGPISPLGGELRPRQKGASIAVASSNQTSSTTTSGRLIWRNKLHSQKQKERGGILSSDQLVEKGRHSRRHPSAYGGRGWGRVRASTAMLLASGPPRALRRNGCRSSI